MTIDPAKPVGYKADIAFERDGAGAMRGAILWTRVTPTGAEVLLTWFTDLGSDSPALHDRTTLLTSPTTSRFGTLVTADDGLRVVMKDASSRARMYRHAAGAPLGSWTSGTTGMTLEFPAAAALASGETLLTSVEPSGDVVAVQRFSVGGAPAPVELRLVGYAQPSLATDGTRAWVIAKRLADGAIVSREFAPASGWSADDRVEVDGTSGPFTWPNAVRTTDGRLRFVMGGPGSIANAASVFAYQRTL
jgi:hypothetical protein